MQVSGDIMEPIYKGFKAVRDFYVHYGYNESKEVDPETYPAREALSFSHDHGCWLNPTGSFYSRRTKKLCKKFWKKRVKPELEGFEELCDMCPNCITYYKDKDNFLFALGNDYLYGKEGKFK